MDFTNKWISKKKKKIEIKKFSLQRNLEQTTYVTHLTLSSCYYISFTFRIFPCTRKKTKTQEKNEVGTRIILQVILTV